jgi:hypothetical protein
MKAYKSRNTPLAVAALLRLEAESTKRPPFRGRGEIQVGGKAND